MIEIQRDRPVPEAQGGQSSIKPPAKTPEGRPSRFPSASEVPWAAEQKISLAAADSEKSGQTL